MRDPSRMLFRGVFGALVLGALGLGATQALATPATRDMLACQAWQQAQCTEWCRSMHEHFPNVVGECSTFGGSDYFCQCAVVPEDQM